MTPEKFITDLRAVAARSFLNESDLALWFERPRSTIRTWLRGERVVRAGEVFQECARRLSLLRLAIAKKHFPVPYHIPRTDRTQYIKQAFKNADNAGISARDPARKR